MPPEDQFLFGVKTDNYSWEEDFDESNAFWTFENINDNNQVFIIEFKYLASKKEEQFEFFNSWRMWHEKFIYNNVMYFVLFQTDEIDNENITDYFSPMVKAISKSYRIKYHQLERKSYYEFKLNLRKADLGEKQIL